MAKKKQKTNKIIKKLKQCLKDKEIALTTDIEFKLRLLENSINDYYLFIEDIERNGIVITFNSDKTKGLNPSFKGKIQTSKLILKLLNEIGLNAPKSNDEIENTENFINYLTS